jgi:heptosyltransferase I
MAALLSLDWSALQHLLIVKPSSLGDVVHTLPAVRRLKDRYPHLRIDWLVNPEWMPLLVGNPDLREVIPFPRRQFRGLKGQGAFWKWVSTFRRRRPQPEVALDFQGLFRSGFLSRASGARIVAGTTTSREGARFFHHQRVAVDPVSHAVDQNLCLAAACGATSGPVQFPLPLGTCPQAVLQATVPRDFVVLHPFSRGENKSLTFEQVRLFCEAMAPIGVFVVGHFPVPEHWTSLPKNAANILNQTTLPELCWVLRQAKFTVSVDSGPMHMAAGISSRVLGIHTWSDPRMVGPYPGDSWIWKAGQICRRQQVDERLAASFEPVSDAHVEAMAAFAWKMLEYR